MRRWFPFLVGPALWAIHFAAAYGIASISIQGAGEVTPLARLVIGAVSAALVLAALALVAPRGGNESFGRFASTIRRTGCLLAAVAIVWQALPLLVR